MLFTRKKSTINASVFHLDSLDFKQRQDHFLEIFKIAKDSLSSITSPGSPLPIHFVLPFIFDKKQSDETLFTSYNASLVSDVLGAVHSHEKEILLPKNVIENFFSPVVSTMLNDYSVERNNCRDSLFKLQKHQFQSLPLSGRNKHPHQILPLQQLPDHLKATTTIEPETVAKIKSRRSTWSELLRSYSVHDGYNKEGKKKKSRTTETKLIERLYKKNKQSLSSVNDSFPNKLITVDYILSLSEIGELLSTLAHATYNKHVNDFGSSPDMLTTYSGGFMNILSTLITSRYRGDDNLKFIDLLYARLGLKDPNVIENINKYVRKRNTSMHMDFVNETYDSMLCEEKVWYEESINNTFVPITFFLYLYTNENLMNDPKEIVTYSNSYTKTCSLKGNFTFYPNAKRLDNYKQDSYITTIDTTILPSGLTELILKSKMTALKDQQLFMQPSNTGLLSTLYGNTYNPKLQDDFVFYTNEETELITKNYLSTNLSKLVKIRFDNKLQVLYLPHMLAEFPLSLYTNGNAVDKYMDTVTKQQLLKYLGIKINYDNSVTKYTEKVEELYNTFLVLNTPIFTVMPKEIKDYLNTWVVSLFIQQKIITKIRLSDVTDVATNWYNDVVNLNSFFRGRYIYDISVGQQERLRFYTEEMPIYTFVLETIYLTLQNYTVTEFIETLKTTILPQAETESKTIIESISTLYKVNERILSWDKDKTYSETQELIRQERYDDSVFNRIYRLLYNKYFGNLLPKINESIKTKNYDSLLIYLLSNIKTYHYFRRLKNGFWIALDFNDGLSHFIREHLKHMIMDPKFEASSYHGFSEIQQIMYQYMKEHPEITKEMVNSKDFKITEELLKWYKEIHLNSQIETF